MESIDTLFDSPAERELFSLRLNRDDIAYKIVNWGLTAESVNFFTGVLGRIDQRIAALEAGIAKE